MSQGLLICWVRGYRGDAQRAFAQLRSSYSANRHSAVSQQSSRCAGGPVVCSVLIRMLGTLFLLILDKKDAAESRKGLILSSPKES